MAVGYEVQIDEAFRVYFNRRRQYVSVYLHEVSPQTFHRRGGGRWGYYIAAEVRGRIGKFGELHFVLDRVRSDVVAHELLHLLADWMRARNLLWCERNEERIALMFDELTRAFWREWHKQYY